MILGKNLILAINGSPLAAAKSCNIQQSQSFIQVASPTAARWKQVVPEALEWSISADCLIGTFDAYNTLDQAWRNGTALTIRYYDTDYNCNKTGTAYIADIRLEGSTGSLAKMSIQLQGSGELSEYGEAMTISRTLEQTSRWYSKQTTGIYSITAYSGSAKIYSGSFTLSQRTLVRINYANSVIGNVVILSQNNDIVTKAHNAETITSQNYTYVIEDSGRVWLDAGTWYFVESSTNYESPTYTKLS